MENPLVLTENLTIKHLLVGETLNPFQSTHLLFFYKNNYYKNHQA